MITLSELVALSQFEVQKSYEYADDLIADDPTVVGDVAAIAIQELVLEFPIVVGFDEVEAPLIKEKDLEEANQSDITYEKLKTPFSQKMVKDRYKLTEQKVEIFHKDLQKTGHVLDQKPTIKEKSKTERSSGAKPATPAADEKALQMNVSQLGTTNAQEFDPNLLGRIKITLKPVLKNG